MSRSKRIHHSLSEAFMPIELLIEDESHQHRVREGAESHFNVLIVSECFQNQTRVVRHQRVYALLSDELNNGLHALRLHLHTPTEWQQKQSALPSAPPCQHKA